MCNDFCTATGFLSYYSEKKSAVLRLVCFTIKSNERSEDSYLGLADFFLFFFFIKTADVHSYMLMHS